MTSARGEHREGRRSRAETRRAAARVTVIGAGRAGSFASLALGMAGIRRLLVYDPDRLDPARNLGVQLYRATDVSRRRLKVEALARVLRDLCPSVSLEGIAERFPEGARGPSGPIVLLSTDTMDSRRRAVEALSRDRSVALLVDLRLGGSVVRCYSASGPKGLMAYRTTLYSDDESWGDPCADSPDPHTALAAAALAAAGVTACLRSESFPEMVTIDVGTRPTMLTPATPEQEMVG